MPRERILIIVKTYPTLSSKSGELVCTAGITESGEWIRIYPVPFRTLDAHQKYNKYTIVEADVYRNHKDHRPESHKVDLSTMKTCETLDTADGWRERKNIILRKSQVHTNLTELIDLAQNKNELSIATFKPTKIKDFRIEAVKGEWGEEKLQALEALKQQGDLFKDAFTSDQLKLVNKLPWKFSYVFEDDEGRESTMMIEDWEIGALYWNCVKTKSPEEAVIDVKNKYLGFARDNDLHLFLGTTKKFHSWSSNPFIIIGCFYPPIDDQPQFEF